MFNNCRPKGYLSKRSNLCKLDYFAQLTATPILLRYPRSHFALLLSSQTVGVTAHSNMVAAAYHQAIHLISCSCLAVNEGSRNFLVTSSSGNFKLKPLFRKERCSLRQPVNCVGHSSNSSLSVVKPMLSLLSSTNDSKRTVPESYLILIRHGESMWNEKNLFTGCVDVPLTNKGVEEAIEAGKRIRHLPIDVVYISALIRSQMTAMLALTEHHCKKVPIIVHNETEQAKLWSQIYSEGTEMQSVPVIRAWQLNERMYGELQGFNKLETAERCGKEQVYKWRRSYDARPPNGESLEMCLRRAVTYFKEQIEPQLSSGKNVMVVAHANSLRSILMYLDKLTAEEVIHLELSTGVPMLYIYKENRFIRRGSPLGSMEAGVYAYTESLALYKQNLLDEVLDEVSL
ncbi:2,3-bisphosphoglycerate-dependent phosphoglycerate mutase 1-like isoform X2 [Lycium barbarum]|uniref:2,3-bisphosphoglycerate-dependent phosphoglycerate mutase 1-like isoform X2 n=1 Tax=Lycium barbarum TaxID=112863 RepID=UPI00293EF7AE|nr:2,3-bisphosphoglycerate-dependent phosphoglycerate mutase 1-like isoform X2 [Lycium barbarum]